MLSKIPRNVVVVMPHLEILGNKDEKQARFYFYFLVQVYMITTYTDPNDHNEILKNNQAPTDLQTPLPTRTQPRKPQRPTKLKDIS